MPTPLGGTAITDQLKSLIGSPDPSMGKVATTDSKITRGIKASLAVREDFGHCVAKLTQVQA